MADRTDRMFDEVDRQLAVVAAQSEALVTRSGILFSAAAIGATVLAARFDHLRYGLAASLWTLGISLILGFAVLIPGLARGPGVASLTSWSLDTDEPASISKLYQAKIETLDTNTRSVVRMSVLFYLQMAAAVVSAVVALIVVGTG